MISIIFNVKKPNFLCIKSGSRHSPASKLISITVSSVQDKTNSEDVFTIGTLKVEIFESRLMDQEAIFCGP